MFNKLTKFAFIAALSAVTSLGCASAPSAPPASPPQAAPAPPVAKVAPAPKKPYTLDVAGWAVVEEAEMEGSEPQRVGAYEYELEDGTKVGAFVTQMKLDKEEVGSFLDAIRSELNNSDKIRLIGQRMVKRGELESYEALIAMKLEHGVAIILAVAVTDAQGNAFYTTCGGDIKAGQRIIEVCKPVIKSFNVAK